jgi:hypothetical protein
MSRYRYKPLRTELAEIRVIHLLPGNYEDQLAFHLLHLPLPVLQESTRREMPDELKALRQIVTFPWEIEETEGGEVILFNIIDGSTQPLSVIPSLPKEDVADELKFEALSYTWGDADISDFAEVDLSGSKEERATLGLRPNLAAALRHLRLRDRVRVLWIDAICINQEDIEERNEQVKRMSHIYSSAYKVIAWLGEEKGGSKHAIETLQHIGRQLKSTVAGRVIAAPDATEPTFWRNDHAPSFEERTWNSLMRLVEREWFYRLWCWQEIKLGGKQALLQCGSDTIPWNAFWLAILCLHNKRWLPSTQFRERCRHIAFLKYDQAGNSMANILDISRSKGCANPRDKIYGLLGITPTSFSTGITVDYLRPVKDVFQEAFLCHTRTTERLELLKHCDLANRQISGPSWVPDWSKTEFAAPILSDQWSTGISRAHYKYTGGDELQVLGKQMAMVKLVSEAASRNENEALLAIKEWYSHLPREEMYCTGEDMQMAFAVNLFMDRSRERHPTQHFLSRREWAARLPTFLGLDHNSTHHPIYAERETANLIQKIRGRRFFVTENGLLGTAPAGIRQGMSSFLLRRRLGMLFIVFV